MGVRNFQLSWFSFPDPVVGDFCGLTPTPILFFIFHVFSCAKFTWNFLQMNFCPRKVIVVWRNVAWQEWSWQSKTMELPSKLPQSRTWAADPAGLRGGEYCLASEFPDSILFKYTTFSEYWNLHTRFYSISIDPILLTQSTVPVSESYSVLTSPICAIFSDDANGVFPCPVFDCDLPPFDNRAIRNYHLRTEHPGYLYTSGDYERKMAGRVSILRISWGQRIVLSFTFFALTMNSANCIFISSILYHAEYDIDKRQL